jgi:glucose-1-phosphate adenylyltransferase
MTARELTRTHALILAGGQGERLHPLTVSRPKPAVSFGGIFRIIDFTLSNCLHSGLSRVSLLTQYKYEELHRYIRHGWRDVWDRASSGQGLLSCVAPAIGKRYRGTADAVFQNMNLLHAGSEFVLVLSADHIYQMDYRELLRRHVETNADLTIATVKYPVRQASHFGVVQVNEDFRVTGFDEKPVKPSRLPSDPSMSLISMGVYLFKKTVLLGSMSAICGSGLGFDFGQDVLPSLIHSVRTYAYDFRSRDGAPGYWRDIGTIDAYYAASIDLLSVNAAFDPYANVDRPSQPTRHPFFNTPVSLRSSPTRVDSTAHVTRTILSPGVQVEEGATVHNSVLMPGVHVGKGARLQRVILEEGTHVPDGFRAGFDLDHDRHHHVVSETGVVVLTQESVARPIGIVSEQVFSRGALANVCLSAENK